MEQDVVLYEALDGNVALVTLNRPEKRNAVNGALAQGLDAAVKRAEADGSIRAVVLASSHDGVFSAGADLKEVAAGNGWSLNTPDGGFAGFVLHERTKPWIAAAKGVVLGGGLEICLACDMIVAAVDASLGLPEVRRGLIAGGGGAWRLAQSIPRAVAVEMMVTGAPVTAARAYELGLVNRVVPAASVQDEALALARLIAANAPVAVTEALAAAKQAGALSNEEGAAATDAAMARLRATADFREGPRAFAEKRAPVWQGR